MPPSLQSLFRRRQGSLHRLQWMHLGLVFGSKPRPRAPLPYSDGRAVAGLTDKGVTIMINTHQTAPTQFVEANGIRFAYRRFGKTGGVPIVFNQHYIGTMDYCDP